MTPIARRGPRPTIRRAGRPEEIIINKVSIVIAINALICTRLLVVFTLLYNIISSLHSLSPVSLPTIYVRPLFARALRCCGPPRPPHDALRTPSRGPTPRARLHRPRARSRFPHSRGCGCRLHPCAS